MIEAANQAMIADGPAIEAAVSAPNSHPDPMIEPSEAHRRPRKPTPRCIPSASSCASFALPDEYCGSATLATSPPN